MFKLNNKLKIKLFYTVIIILMIIIGSSNNKYVDMLQKSYQQSYYRFGSIKIITQKFDLNNATQKNIETTLLIIENQLQIVDHSFNKLAAIVNRDSSGLKKHLDYICNNLKQALLTKDTKKFNFVKEYINHTNSNFYIYEVFFDESLDGRVERLPLINKIQFNKVYNRLLKSLGRIKKDY
ncbi:hypothetical protein IMX26_12345 [Clostridium sp. 'deep sea']|uniref:hypothetical protein n=1 Tax=Clostridium sp. 'deep sea' TaxID=2779445 RepID=UPI00189661C7|nr:hypothetical protein [Clostridium sp. 'deep sea']QOR34276.1 hypothetical protein IMX26_12345 [Clostridium sp. 'deep sea']